MHRSEHIFAKALREIQALCVATAGREPGLSKRIAYRVSPQEWYELDAECCRIGRDWRGRDWPPRHNHKYDTLTIFGVDVIIDERLVHIPVLKDYARSG